MLLPVAKSVALLLELLPKSSSPSPWNDGPSTFVLLLLFFVMSSFPSINDKNLWRRLERVLPGSDEIESEGADLHNCCIICKKYTTRAMKQATPHIKKRPQKLLRWSRSDSSSAFSKLQLLFISHLSWIRCRSPFSASSRIALDKSTASGESRGNA